MLWLSLNQWQGWNYGWKRMALIPTFDPFSSGIFVAEVPSYVQCSTALNLPQIIHKFAESQDVIGWDNFVMGMVSLKLLWIQSTYLHNSNSSSGAMRWISGLITQLLQLTHTQWIYQCNLVHNRTTGTLISTHKKELLKEIELQLSLGPEGLEEEDRFLLECNFDNLTMTTGDQQEYWLLAIQAAREAPHIHTETMAAQQQRNSDTTHRDGHKFAISN